jgi:hypothetical protein
LRSSGFFVDRYWKQYMSITQWFPWAREGEATRGYDLTLKRLVSLFLILNFLAHGNSRRYLCFATGPYTLCQKGEVPCAHVSIICASVFVVWYGYMITLPIQNRETWILKAKTSLPT